MGIRGIERRLAAELCYEAVAEAVDDYLAESREAGRLLWPHEHLVLPIIRAGYYPPGLLGVKDFIFRHQDVARAERKHVGEEAGELSLPDEGELAGREAAAGRTDHERVSVGVFARLDSSTPSTVRAK